MVQTTFCSEDSQGGLVAGFWAEVCGGFRVFHIMRLARTTKTMYHDTAIPDPLPSKVP